MMNTEKKRKNKRWSLLSNRKFQIKFILLTLVITLTQSCIHFLSLKSMSQELQVALGGAAGMDPTLKDVLLAANSTFIVRSVGVSLLYCIIISIFGGLLLSHYISGPVYRTTQVLRQLAEGQTVEPPVRFRKGDFFPELQEALSRVVDVIRNPRG